MAARLQGVRGMKDILPEETPLWQWLEATVRELLAAYNYREIRLPLLEPTALFERSIGDVTDIVEKEMYTFADRNGDSLTLRPEGTAGCVRAGIEQGLLHNQVRKLWYQGPMFRHERPQKGRYRQFHQVGVEVFGLTGPDIDAELILMTARLWRALGLTDLRLELNTLGTPASRLRYRETLTAYFRGHIDALDEDSRRRLERNPLRILDSKNPAMAGLIADAPGLADSLDEDSRAHFQGLCAILDAAGVAYVVNPRLVRGLDYYTLTVFEWITTSLGAQGTVCAGGRYDGLVEQIGGRATPAVGFAMGLERLVAMLAEQAEPPTPEPVPHACIVAAPEATARALTLAETLRTALPGLRLETLCGGGSMKSQFKRADRCGAGLALVLGEAEAAAGEIGIKPLRGSGAQETLAQDALVERLPALLGL